MENKFFLHQIKKTSGFFDKGIVVKDSLEDAKQGFHAYMGAYAYGHDPSTVFVQAMVTDLYGNIINPFYESWASKTD